MRDKELKDLIRNSSLDETDKEIWNIFIDGVTENEISPILETLQENPENLGYLTDNLREKFWALRRGHKEMLKNILDKEKEFLTDTVK